jgi:23S rRNA pseudouridine2605 synthase
VSAPQRVQKLLAAAGLGSRRACEQFIVQGRVAVDGRTVTLGDKARPDQHITLDGERVNTDPGLVYFLLNKPQGYVTTMHDPLERPTVMDLVPSDPRVFPVGRLDQDTEGLLLLTNDGDLTNRLLHPRYEVRKTYVAKVRGAVHRRSLRTLTAGVELDDGPARALSARVLGEAADESLVEVVIAEGRKREVRRLMGAAGLHVERLARVKFGSLELGETSPGKFRPLTGKEVRDLYRDVNLGDVNLGDADPGNGAGSGRAATPEGATTPGATAARTDRADRR